MNKSYYISCKNLILSPLTSYSDFEIIIIIKLSLQTITTISIPENLIFNHLIV